MRTLRTLFEDIHYEGMPDGRTGGAWGKSVGRAAHGRCFVYQFFGSDENLLYVGITSQPQYRWQRHARREWWSDVVRAEVFEMPSEFYARDAERWVIKTNNPIHNIAQKVSR